MQEMKICEGETSRDVRQWKKNIKQIYTPLIEQKEMLVDVLKEQLNTKVRDMEREIIRET